MDISIITATWQRPNRLAQLLAQVAAQATGGLKIEHLVISDGPDPLSRRIVRGTSVRYLELPAHRGNFGAACKDAGIAAARGEYVCFWDDDNQYDAHALLAQYATARGAELGIVRVRHWMRRRQRFERIPRRWDGQLRCGDIDTMCVCVRRELAAQADWDSPPRQRGTDYRWLSRLATGQPRINYAPICIGTHLALA